MVKEVLTSAKQARWPLIDIDCCMPLSASLCIRRFEELQAGSLGLMIASELLDYLQAYLSGERLPKYGGDVIENETGGGRRQLPNISQVEAEAAIQELLARPELARPAHGVALPVLPTKAQVRSGKRVDLPKVGCLSCLHSGCLPTRIWWRLCLPHTACCAQKLC